MTVPSHARRQPPRLRPQWQAALPDHAISIGWSGDGSLVAGAAVSGPIVVWESSSGAVRHQWPGHGFGTTMIAWHPTRPLLASAGQDGKVRLWDLASGQEAMSIDGGAAWVERLAWSPKGEYLASSAGRTVRLWTPDGKMVRELPAQRSTVADLTWRPGSTDLTVAAYGGLSVWIPESDSPKRAFEWKGSILALAWSPDSKYIATGNQDATVDFWIWKSGVDLQMSGYPVKVRQLAWDPTSRYLATGGSCMVTVWDCSGRGPEGSRPIQLEAHGEDHLVTALAYQKSGPYLVSGGNDGRLGVWNPSLSRASLASAQLDGEITQVAWSPSDLRVAAATEAGTVALFSA